MVIKKHILNTIGKLDALYNSSASTQATYYSKLAIIELCGWIEYSMDEIAQHFANRKIRSIIYRDIFNGFKNKTYGFDYKSNFRKMLYQTIGLHNMESIELKLERTGQITLLTNELQTLKTLRDHAAHTYIGATTTYQAPSVTKAQLLRIYPILKEISKEIRGVR